jgi:hypothetical protein
VATVFVWRAGVEGTARRGVAGYKASGLTYKTTAVPWSGCGCGCGRPALPASLEELGTIDHVRCRRATRIISFFFLPFSFLFLWASCSCCNKCTEYKCAYAVEISSATKKASKKFFEKTKRGTKIQMHMDDCALFSHTMDRSVVQSQSKHHSTQKTRSSSFQRQRGCACRGNKYSVLLYCGLKEYCL